MKLEDIKIVDQNLMSNVTDYDDYSKLDIAIIGMAFEFPQANTAEQFWDNLVNGKSSIRSLPTNRKEDTEKYFSGFLNKAMQENKGGYLDHIDYFDYDFFDIAPNEAVVIDPNQRMFLEVVWHALEDAGYINTIKESKTGIYVGFGDDAEYLNMIEKIKPNMKDIAVIGNTKSLISGRISHMLDLKGPSMNIDTACSSSLVALHLACQGIRNGDYDMAIAGGIRLFVNPGKENLNLGISSKEGVVRPFDENADGTMWGEGVAALILKPLAKAESAGDHIYAVIKGSAINQDGASIGIIAPNGNAQEEVIKSAWKNAGIRPETITYIETHGTGTKLGDPIEAKAINDSFQQFTNEKEFCCLGSLKANIGHLAEVSGIASVIKAVLSIQNNMLTSNLKLNQINSHINKGGIYFLKENRIWSDVKNPKRCGISSFGFNGTNCHLIMEEYRNKEEKKVIERKQIFTLSAKTENALHKLVDDYIAFIKTTKFDLENICYTANIGRKAFQYRIGFSISTKDELLNKLQELKNNSYIFSINKKENDLIKKYINGDEIDWRKIYHGKIYKKITLPLYPFQKTRCWITDLVDSKGIAFTLKGRNDKKYTSTEKTIASVIYDVLGIQTIDIFENISEHRPDSIILVKIYNELKQYFPNIRISEIFSFSDIYSLANYIDQNNNNAQKINIKVPTNNTDEHDIAVIGMAVKLPGIENLNDFWKLIINRKTTIGKFPYYRANQIKTYLNKLSEKYNDISFEKGSYLSELDKFDFEYFNISQKDADLMDPGQRLFLETVISALGDAGYSLRMVKGRNIAVYTGFSAGALFNYGKMIYDLEPESLSMAITSNHPSILPGRVSYYLDLKGPSVNIDTACSSSLVALSQACNEIRNGNCDMAIVGGVHYDLAPIDIPGRKIGAESKKGIVRAFDDESDGMLWGEGIGAVILKPLRKAISDNDGIYAIIEGVATNQDGKSMGIAAPNSLSQTEVIEKAWIDAKINPENIDYIETHGTGTYLGDPVEIEGIQRAFNKYTNKKQFCGISSLKPNIGHLEAAAGIFSFMKAVLSLHNKTLPPIANLECPNSKIDFTDSAMYLIDTASDWEKRKDFRRCGISAFGFSGTNCHVVLREYEEKNDENSNTNTRPFLLTISANEEDILIDNINMYISYLNRATEQEVEALCYTSNISNNNYPLKIAIIANTKDELIRKMKTVLSAKFITTDCGIYYNENKYDLEKTVDMYEKACLDFIEGKTVDWETLYENRNIVKKHVGISPFRKTKCWLYGLNKNKEIKFKGKTSLSSLEKAIGEIWAENLGMNTLDVNANFYSLGGHSIIMMKIISDIQKKINISVSYNEFSQNLSVEKMANIIAKRQNNEGVLQIIGCTHDEKNMYDIFPVTELQKAYIIGRNNGMFFGGVSGHIYMEIETDMNLEKIEISLNKVIRRHPMLHTIIFEDGTQRILKDIPEYKIETYSVAENQENAFIEQMRNQMSHHVMPLGVWPLFEVKALKLKDNKSYLFIGIDVLIVDGGSLSILGNEILEFYKNPQKQLPSIQINIRDYMTCYGRIKKSKQYLIDQKYWKGKIKDIFPAPSFQYKITPNEVTIPKFSRMTHEFTAAEWSLLQNVGKKIGVSPVAMICEIYAEVLAYWSNQPCFTINFTAFNRYPCHPDVDLMIGDFTSVLLIKLDMRENDAYEERVKKLQNEINNALEHRLYDGIEIIRELSKNNPQKAEPLMPFVFTSMLYGGRFPWNDFGKVKYSLSQTPQVYLDCQAVSTDNSIIINWDYVEQLFDKETINIMFEQMINMINYLITEMEVN